MPGCAPGGAVKVNASSGVAIPGVVSHSSGSGGGDPTRGGGTPTPPESPLSAGGKRSTSARFCAGAVTRKPRENNGPDIPWLRLAPRRSLLDHRNRRASVGSPRRSECVREERTLHVPLRPAPSPHPYPASPLFAGADAAGFPAGRAGVNPSPAALVVTAIHRGHGCLLLRFGC